MTQHYQAYHPGLKRLSGTVEQQRAALDAISAEDMQAASTWADIYETTTDPLVDGVPWNSSGSLVFSNGAAIPTGSLAAWGFYKCTTRELCCRVRRSSDNTELDIGFVGKWIDAATLISFVGAGSGYVTKLYADLSTGDWSQSTTTKQPLIVSSGSPILTRYAAGISFDGVDDILSSPSLAHGTKVTAMIFLQSMTNINTIGFCSGTAINGTQDNWYGPLINGTGDIRVGTATVGVNYDLYDKAVTLPSVVGGQFDMTLASGSQVVPVLGSTASQSGWTRAFTGSGSGFSTVQTNIGGDTRAGTFAALQTRGMVVYPSILSASNIATVAKALGHFSSGIAIGDSTVATYAGGTEVANYVLSGADHFRTHGITTIAVPGHTIAQQKTVWQSTTGRDKADWVIIQVGLNDMDPSVSTTAGKIAEYQDLVDTVRSDNATCKIIVATMTPAYERWPVISWNQAQAQARWVALNDAIKGLGSTPILRVDARVSSHTTSLSYNVSGNAALAPAYDTGDKIHTNNAGRTINGAAWRVALASLSLT